MRLLIHDYAGHAFPVQLSRGLAARGHDIEHTFCTATHAPRGELNRRDDDPETFHVNAISLDRTIAKYNFFDRFKLESEYGRKLEVACEKFRPDAVISGNTPSLVQARLVKWCNANDIRVVTWVQDLYGLAAKKILSKKLPGIGHLVGGHMMRLDKTAARNSDQVVVITEDFEPLFTGWGVDPAKLRTIHNWAPIEDLPVGNRDNAWSQARGLDPNKLRFVYSGTLSIRHNPELLVRLGEKLDEWGNAELIVISEGAGIDWVREQANEQNIRSIQCLDFQPFEQMNEVFASADALIAILEPDASVFCVPSKVLTYMCASRPLLTAIPAENQSAKIVENNGAGLVVDPDNVEQFLDAARRLYDDAELRAGCGRAARQYAEQTFDIKHICDQFEEILTGGRVPAGV